jgi:hypothetical protein
MLKLFLGTLMAGVCLAGCGGSSSNPTPTFMNNNSSGTSSSGTSSGTGMDTTTTTGAGGSGSTDTTGAGGTGSDTMMMPVDTQSRVALDGYVTAGMWAGSGFTATEPAGAMITPDCSSGTMCTPAYAGTQFCMQGTVTGEADYSGFAMLGWNVNQPLGMDPGTWATPATGGITVTVANQPSTVALRVQLQGTDSKDPNGRWCAALTSGKPIAWTDFKTNCWTGGMPQTPLPAGTMIQQAAIMVPGITKDLPYNVCLVDVQIQ